MKVNPYANIQNVYRKQVEKQQQKQDVAKSSDKVEISSEAKLMQQELKISAERQEKIDALKEKIESGNYQINAEQVARKFYDFWNE